VRKVGTVRHHIRDVDGKVVGTHVRENRLDGKRMYWDPKLNGTPVTSVPLYGSHEWRKWSADDPIVLTEGEAARDALAARQINALGTVTGARVIPSPEVLALLHGRHVVLWPDNDELGRRHMQAIARHLDGKVASLRQVEWDDAPEHGDAADYRADPRPLIEQAPEWKAATSLNVVPLSAVDREDPQPLLLGRLDPQEHTILFGDGGTGKGIVASWWIARLSRDGHRVLIVDYERHARYEWRPRVERFGGDLDAVFIVQPDPAIWDCADDLRAAIEDLAASYVVIDSVGYACMGQEVEKSATATRYSAAIARLDSPVLSLAHTTKADADPKHPFGSVFWSNGARITIGMVGSGDGPRVLTNKKTNQRAPFAPVEIDWGWVEDGLPATLTETQRQVTIADRAYMALGHDALTTEEIVLRVNADGGAQVSAHSMRTVLARSQFVHRDGDVWRRAIRVRPPVARDVAREGV
jgi:hypothetical protein